MEQALFFAFLTITIICNIIASFSTKNHIVKVFFTMMTIAMIILASSQSWNYDYEAYRYYYELAGRNNISGVELGFIAIAVFSKKVLLLDYVGFRALFFLIMFGVVAAYIWKLSERPCLVQLLYFFLFFAVNITQIRSGMSEAFVIASVYYLNNNNKIKYCISMALAIMFHYSAFFFLLFMLLDISKTEKWIRNNTKTIAIVSVIMLIAFRAVSAVIPLVVRYLNAFLGNDYRAAANFADYAGNHYLKYLPVPIITIFLFYLLRDFIRIDYDSKRYELMAYISLVIYPLFTINRQLSRISRTVVILSLIPFTKYALRSFNKNRASFILCFIVFIGYVYYCLSAYTSCLDALLHYSNLAYIFD